MTKISVAKIVALKDRKPVPPPPGHWCAQGLVDAVSIGRRKPGA